MTIKMPATITKFEPAFDVDWIKANTDFNEGDQVTLSGLNNEIFVVEDDGNEVSLYDLAKKLTQIGNAESGKFSKQVKLENGYIHGPDFRYKIRGYFLEYVIPEPYSEPTVIDFSKELIGVIEYLQKGTKKSIFKRGAIRENLLPKGR